MLASVYQRSFSYTSRAGFFFLCSKFVLHIPCCFQFCGRSLFDTSFFLLFFFPWMPTIMLMIILALKVVFAKSTSRAAFIFMRGVSLTRPKLPSFLCGEFASFLCGEFLLHIPCWLLFIRGVSLTHPELTSYFCLTHPVLAFLLCEELPYFENNPLRKELSGSWPRRKV